MVEIMLQLFDIIKFSTTVARNAVLPSLMSFVIHPSLKQRFCSKTATESNIICSLTFPTFQNLSVKVPNCRKVALPCLQIASIEHPVCYTFYIVYLSSEHYQLSMLAHVPDCCLRGLSLCQWSVVLTSFSSALLTNKIND